MKHSSTVFWFFVIMAAMAPIAAKVMASGTISSPLTLAQANAALRASGGMVGNVFAVGENRYLVQRSQLVAKKGSDVFIGEIEIKPLPKNQ
jgi:hypothetical protein